MFSTVDARDVRVLREGPGGEEEVRLPRSLRDEADRAAVLPTEARLRALARSVAARPELAGAALRVEAWESRFGPSLRPEPRLLRSLRVEPDGG
jgi:hypothetical protein